MKLERKGRRRKVQEFTHEFSHPRKYTKPYLEAVNTCFVPRD